METATRYFATIEKLMIEVSRLNKELKDSMNGKLPSRCIPEEMADKCFSKIAEYIGPVARGTLLDEISILCDQFKRLEQEYLSVIDILKHAKQEKTAIDRIVKGDDIDENYNPTSTVNSVSRLRAVLEVTKTRIDRFVNNGNSELIELRNELAQFLSGNK